MTWIRSAIFGAGLPLVVASAAPCTATVCPVPSVPHPTIQEAVDDLACSEVTIAAGTFVEEVNIGRDLDVVGASSATTIIEGRMVVEGAAIQVDVHDLTIDASSLSAAGCFTGALLSRSGAHLSANGVVAINGDGDACLLFQDGFESGNTTEWSTTVP